MNILGIALSFALALALLWVVQTYALGQKFEIVPAIINIVVVLVVVAIASWATSKIVKKEGIKVGLTK